VRLVRPAYPHEARRLGKEGLVILKLSLEASGEVGAIEVLQSAGHGMDEAARKAVQQSRFRAATRGGRPVGCQAILPVRFTLR
jgi:protein TonB